MRSTALLRTLAFVGLGGVAGCGGSQANLAAPSVPSLSGNWVGSLDPGAVPLQFTLAQSGDAVSGTWTIDGSDGIPAGSGSLNGRVFASSMSMVLTWSGPTTNCPLTLSASLDSSGTQMTGGISSPNCGGYFSSGGFRATRR